MLDLHRLLHMLSRLAVGRTVVVEAIADSNGRPLDWHRNTSRCYGFRTGLYLHRLWPTCLDVPVSPKFSLIYVLWY